VDFLNAPNPSSRSTALGSTQPTEMRTRNLPEGVKGCRRVRLTTLPPSASRLSIENVGTSTSHNPMGLHDLLERYLYFFFFFTEPCTSQWVRIFSDFVNVAPCFASYLSNQVNISSLLSFLSLFCLYFVFDDLRHVDCGTRILAMSYNLRTSHPHGNRLFSLLTQK
jgi:hypothetical protein